MSRQRSTINNRKTHLGVALTSVLIFGVSLSLGFTSPPRSHVPLKVSKMKVTKTAMEPISLESHAIDDILALADYHPQNGASPLEKNICEEQREFELKLGKALDTLRKDYPKILTEDPGECPLAKVSNFKILQRGTHSISNFLHYFCSQQIIQYTMSILK